MMLLPPTSSRKVVRLRNAATITKLGRLYGALVAVVISGPDSPAKKDGGAKPVGSDTDSRLPSTDSSEGARAIADIEKGHSRAFSHSKSSTDAPLPKWGQAFREDLISITDDLRALKQVTNMAKWEGSMRGRWPVELYTRLVEVQEEIVGGLSGLAVAIWNLSGRGEAGSGRETGRVNWRERLKRSQMVRTS
jgi:hypothetical protein